MDPTYGEAHSRGQFIRGLKIQARVLGAMIMREVVSRYGRENIGFLWLMLEPMILTGGVMIMWTLLRHEAHGLAVVAFVLSGYMPLTLWRHVTGHAVSCLRQNLPLMYHRQIRLPDALLSRGLLEIAGTTTALVVVYTVVRLAGFMPPYENLGLLLAGWLFMAWFAFAVGLIFAAASERFRVRGKVRPADAISYAADFRHVFHGRLAAEWGAEACTLCSARPLLRNVSRRRIWRYREILL